MDDTYAQPSSGPTFVPAQDGVRKNDTVPCPSSAVLTDTKQPKHGKVDLLISGSFFYEPTTPSVPNKGDFFTYRAECPSGLASEATVFLPGEPVPQGSAWQAGAVPSGPGIAVLLQSI